MKLSITVTIVLSTLTIAAPLGDVLKGLCRQGLAHSACRNHYNKDAEINTDGSGSQGGHIIHAKDNTVDHELFKIGECHSSTTNGEGYYDQRPEFILNGGGIHKEH